MRTTRLGVLLCVLIAAAAVQPAAAQSLFLTEYNANLHEVDSTTGMILNTVVMTLPGETIERGTALATQPGTGVLYGVLQVSGTPGRELVTIDPATGACTSVGNTGDRISSIAFRSSGALYGMVGQGAVSLPANSLVTLSLTDGTPTVVGPLNGVGGQAIAFNPDDGLLYHTAGREGFTPRVFESVDVDTMTITPIPISGYVWEGCMGLAYAGSNTFMGGNGFGDILFTLTTGGVATVGATLVGTQVNSLEYNPLVPVELMGISVE